MHLDENPSVMFIWKIVPIAAHFSQIILSPAGFSIHRVSAARRERSEKKGRSVGTATFACWRVHSEARGAAPYNRARAGFRICRRAAAFP